MPAYLSRRSFLTGTALGATGLTALNRLAFAAAADDHEAMRIRPWAENPFYWQYQGRPVLLLGGSREDNLFNHPEGLADHLDVLRACGGNYIRNTMSSRNPGNRWPFKRLESGLYDLEQWDEEYWTRFRRCLELCHERDIIVQIEVWDPWDYFQSEAVRRRGYGEDSVGWESCPYNPKLNINYTAEESGLAEVIDYYSTAAPSPHLFFHTVPELEDIPLVRRYQEAFVEKLLSISLDFPNVLYCMNNETGEPPEWGQYWARFIRARAEEARRSVYLADMRRNSDFMSAEQVQLLHDRDHYDFFEISQNNGNSGQRHYDMILAIRSEVLDRPKPLNNVKIYGGEIPWTRSAEEATRRFWRNVFGGCASARFHRPAGPSPYTVGIALTDMAQTHIRSARMLTEAMNVFTAEPSNDLLSDRSEDEAYCLAEPGRQYAVYFPDGGEVTLDLSDASGTLTRRWLDIQEAEWTEETSLRGADRVRLSPPGGGHWAVLIVPRGE